MIKSATMWKSQGDSASRTSITTVPENSRTDSDANPMPTVLAEWISTGASALDLIKFTLAPWLSLNLVVPLLKWELDRVQLLKQLPVISRWTVPRRGIVGFLIGLKGSDNSVLRDWKLFNHVERGGSAPEEDGAEGLNEDTWGWIFRVDGYPLRDRIQLHDI